MNRENEMQTALEKELQPFKELISQLVSPENRASINIIDEHITPLRNTKKKNIVRKKSKKKLTTLTRKEYNKLGLYKLPKEGLKYSEVLPLHDLWKSYMKEHLSLDTKNPKIPEVYEPNYDAFSKLLMKSDLHGAIITVSKSKCPNFVGQKGIVVLETKNVLKIVSEDNKLRTLPKADSIFTINLDNVEFTIFGKYLTIRPSEKSVKKIKNFIDIDL